MNGQQLTNSSSSANGTPSSSYPGSLSSQSSRDPSPATQSRKPLPESFNHVITSQPNHWPGKNNSSPRASPAHQVQRELLLSSSTPPASQPKPFPSQQHSPSQPMYNFPPPTSLPQPLPPSTVSQTNHLPQPNSVPDATRLPPHSTTQNTQLSEQPRFTQSPLQSSSSSQFQKQPSPQPPSSKFLLQNSNQFQNPTLPFQQHHQSQNMHSGPDSQTPQPPQISPQFPNQIPPLQNKYPPLPGQLSQSINQIPPLQNKYPQPPVQLGQSSTNQMPPLQNKYPQPPVQLGQSSTNQIPPLQNKYPQPPIQLGQSSTNQIPPLQNKYPQFTNQSSQSTNQTLPPQKYPSQLPGQLGQPTNQTPPLPKTSQPPNLYTQNTNQIPQTQYRFPQPPNLTTQPQNKFSNLPNEQPPPPSNQFPQNQSQLPQPPNQMAPAPNQTPHPTNHYPPSQYQQQLPVSGTVPSQTHHMGTPAPVYQNQYPNSAYPQAQPTSNQFNKRYPQMPGFHQQPGSVDGLTPHMAGMTVQQGFNKLWGMDTVDLLKCREVLPKERIEPPHVRLQQELYESANCSPEIFRCTLTKIPETKSLLDKSRLPLGVLIHPFKDLNDGTDDSEEDESIKDWNKQNEAKQLSVVQCTVIVRCRMCRTYINPFVYFVDNKRWKCNLCFRVNELPDEFQFDPMSKTYGDPSRRPEIKSATIEFIAPSEYMVRPPQPAVYVFLLDVSRLACESGYLQVVCRTLLSELDNVPGDARTSLAFITYDSAVHFYSLAEGQGQPHQMTVVDIEDMFLPTPDNLLVSLNDCRELITDLLDKLPQRYQESYDTHSALGPALQAAYKLLAPTGGRVTVFQSCLPNAGPGALTAREDPAQRAGDNPPHLNPSTDFYKKLALDCSGQQIAVDLFLVNSQYLDLATLSGVSRFSGGCIYHVPLYRSDKPLLVTSLERMFQRYLTRKIGFESVMRLRCTRGLSIHTFHGNFFVRSTDLLSLPNANPDAGFGMQVTIEENLNEVQNICFQAALLYTSSKGERRIRVHTLCLPIASNLADILHGADQQCIVGLLAKMAADRAVQSSLSDAREAFVNVLGDVLSAFRLTQSSNTTGCMLAPANLRLLPLYVLALLKHVAFRVGQSTRLDDRVFAMCQMKCLPLSLLMQSVYPDLYPLLNIENQPQVEVGDSTVAQLPRLQLSAEHVDSLGLFLLDDGCCLLIYVGHNLNPAVCQAVFNVPHFSAIPQELYSLPELDNPTSEALRNFISYLQNEKPYLPPLQVIRDDSHHRTRFLERLIEDKNEAGTSYVEFLQRIKALVK